MEHDNLRSALSWSLGGDDPLLGGRIAAALSWFWQLRSHLGEGERWLAEARMHAGSWPAELRARLLQGHGQLTYYRGETVSDFLIVEAGAAATARDQLGSAVELWRRTGAARPLAETLAYFGIAAGEAGDPEASRAAGDEAVLVARNSDDRWSLGLALWACGATAVLGTSGTPDSERAEPLLEESVELLRPTGDRWALAAPLFYLGLIARQRGDVDRAWRLVEEATGLVRAIGDKWRLATGLRLLATLSAERGDHLAAARLEDQAQAVEQDLGRLRVPA
jgi:tetratricopeptide (TPR) repeat protein